MVFGVDMCARPHQDRSLGGIEKMGVQNVFFDFGVGFFGEQPF